MPNHVTNIVTFEGDRLQIQNLMEAVKADEIGVGSIDFNKLIPMPKELEIEQGSETMKGLKLYRDFVLVYSMGKELTAEEKLTIPKEREEAFLAYRKDVDRRCFELGKQAFQNVARFGAATWYDWCIGNWGTKWNSYGYDGGIPNVQDNAIRFLTAWSAPHPILQKLSELYPDVEIQHEWADEDIGVNCGRHTYRNGERIEEYFPEIEKDALEFAGRIMNVDLSDYGLFLNQAETEYIRFPDEEFEMIELFGKPALFTNTRMTDADVPQGCICYQLRMDDTNDHFATIEKTVTVNFGGTVLVANPIDLGPNGFIELDADSSPNFLGDTYTLEEIFANANHAEEEMEMM